MSREYLMQTIVCFAMLGMVAQAEYAPKVDMSMYPKKEITQGVAALRALPTAIRQGVIADKLGLLYVHSGAWAHDTEEKTSKHGVERLYDVKKGALFIGSDGKEYDFWLDCGDAAAKKGYDIVGKSGRRTTFGNYVGSREAISVVDGDPIFLSFSGEITRMVKQLVKYRLKGMNAKLRQLCLADCAELFVLPGSESAYTDSPVRMKRDGSRKMLEWTERVSGAKFYDAQGKEQDADEVYETYATSEQQKRAYEDVLWCAFLIGKEDVLSLYTKEVKAMRKYHAEAMDKMASLVGTSEAPKKAVTYEPAPLPPGYYPSVDLLKTLPQRIREAFFAELYAMVYDPKGAVPVEMREVKPCARYTGSDGREYNLAAEHGNLTGPYASVVDEIVQDAGLYIIYHAYAAEIQAMAKNTMTKVLKLMPEAKRDVWLVHVDDLLFSPGGASASMGMGSYNSYEMIAKFKGVKQDALYADSQGVTRQYKDANPLRLHNSTPHRFNLMMLYACVPLLGRDAVLSLVPEEVSVLRENFVKAGGTLSRPPETLQATVETDALVQALRRAEPSVRQAYLANAFGAYYTANGDMPRFGTMGNTLYLCADGTEKSLRDELKKLPPEINENNTRLEALYPVFSAFAEEATSILRRTADKRLMFLPMLEREALLAELAGLVSEPNSVPHYGYISTGGISYRIKSFSSDATFVDSQGTRHRLKEMKVHDQSNELRNLREQILCFAQLIGKRAILASFPKAVETLRQRAKEAPPASGGSAPLGTPSSGAPLGDPQPSSGRTTAMGTAL